MITVHGFTPSGNCQKVRLLLEQLGREYRWIEVDSSRGETRTPEFLAKNPNGRVPMIELDDGRTMVESNAILFWLAEGTAFLPADSWQRAQALSWMFFEQYSHEPYIAVARFIRGWTPLDSPRRSALPGLHERGIQALAVMEQHLSHAPWFTGDDYGMLLDKRRLDPAAWAQVAGQPGTWDQRPGLLAISATADRDLVFGALGRPEEIPAVATVVERVADGRRTLARGVFPLHGGDGTVVGGVVVLHDITPLLAGADEVGRRVVLLVVLLAAALAALVVFLLESLVFERIERMSRSLEGLPERLARGEYGPPEVAPRRDDELGRFEAFLDRAVASIGSFVAEARRAPTGRHRAVRPTERDL
jgi:glutathione S-transferase